MALSIPAPLSIADYDGSDRLDIDGNIVIRSKVGASVRRRNFQQKMLPSPGAAGLPGWERAHSQGSGTGLESALAIYYAPCAVNQALQNRGVEDKLRQLQKLIATANASADMQQRGDRITLVQTTATSAHRTDPVTGKPAETNRLKEITYAVQVYSERLKKFRTLFEVWIEVSNHASAPAVRFGVTEEISARWNDPAWIFFTDAG